MGRTIEEKFLIKIYEMGEEHKNLDLEVNIFDVGRAVGQNDRATQSIVKVLLRSNFIRKAEEDFVSLTENGKSLVKGLLNKK